MKATIARLLVFFLGIPAIAAVCLLLPGWNSVGISALVILFSGLGGIEAAALLPEGRTRIGSLFGFACGLLPPLVVYLAGMRILHPDAVYALLGGLVLVSIGIEVPASADRIPGINGRFLAKLFPLAYPGILSAFMVKIGALPDPGPKLLLFFALSFGNDSLAWLFGVLLGRRRNIVAVSPNKSYAGFIGGMAASVSFAAVARLAFPAAFPGPVWAWAILGLLTGLGVILGDLSESALKRSAGVKDSGSIIPGRGGVLDSIDSLIFAAPLFWAWLTWFPGALA